MPTESSEAQKVVENEPERKPEEVKEPGDSAVLEEVQVGQFFNFFEKDA